MCGTGKQEAAPWLSGRLCPLVLLERHLGLKLLAKRDGKKYVKEIYFLQSRAKLEIKRMKIWRYHVQRKNEEKVNCKKEKGSRREGNPLDILFRAPGNFEFLPITCESFEGTCTI